MNTRSSTASRRRRMIVDLSSENAENTSYLTGTQTGSERSVIKEKQNIQNALEKNKDEFCTGVSSEETNTKTKSPDLLFNEKDDFSLSRGVTTRSSSRPGKRQRNISPPRSVSTTPESSKPYNKRLKSSGKPPKRQWESWGPKEKDVFFEAILEHSKDFDKITNYLMKRRENVPSIARNKDQVRHFYYRTLNKISKYIPEKHGLIESKKTNYEVRCLICYGELRKKFRCLKEKDGKKLTELIATGKTTVRHQGRNVYIRAPVCRALKKQTSNIIDEVEQVPNKIIIELVPEDNKTWSVIQALAQNPRLRTTVSSKKSLYNLFVYLNSKWKLNQGTGIILSPTTKNHTQKAVLNKKSDNGEIVVKSKQSSEDKTVGDPNVEEDSLDKTPGSNMNSEMKPILSEASKSVNDENLESPVGSKEGHSTKCTKEQEVLPTKDVSPRGKEQSVEKLGTVDGNKSADLEKDGVLSETNGIREGKDDAELSKNEPHQDKSPDNVVIEQHKWDLSKCNGTTIADVYRKLGCPNKLSLCYNLTADESNKKVLMNNAIEQLVKLAMGEFRAKNDAKNATKKDSTTPLSKGKESTAVSKTTKVSKSSSKASTKAAPKLAPKPVPEQSLVIPSIVPSMINQISSSTSTKTGNHVTFGFTPISSFTTPSPFLPKTKKSRKSHVVVQRTLLPRPGPTAQTSSSHKEQFTTSSFVPSPVAAECSSPQPAVLSPHQTSNKVKKVVSTTANDQESQRNVSVPTSSSTTATNSSLSVESFLNLALSQELPDNVEKLLSNKTVNNYDGTVRTEELESGVAGGATTTSKTSSKESSSLVDAIEDLHNHKFDHCVEQHHGLLENLKSSEDEDPLKLFTPPHGQQFNPEWLNEESSDFSLSNIFDHMDHSPTKHKTPAVLDTPKKGATDFRLTDGREEDVPRYVQPEPVFCDLVDESSVDYVKKFRDLAKKMTNDSDVSPPSTSASITFKSLLSSDTTTTTNGGK